MNISELRNKANELPLVPGIYIMKDKTGKIIYIGKAKSLKNRITSYFRNLSSHTEKVLSMVKNVDNFEYIIADSEFEALVLECSLIKHNRPKYNILLKDDKGYNYIKLSNDYFPKITAEKQKLDDKAKYLGPYTSSFAVKQSVDEACKIFKLPLCSKVFSEKTPVTRPCLNYYIKQCVGVCSKQIKRSDYLEAVNEAFEFLKGSNGFSIKELTEKMLVASDNLEFEKAAKLRDRIDSIKKVTQKQKVVLKNNQSMDVIGYAKVDKKTLVIVFKFRDGRLNDKTEDFLGETEDIGDTLSEFISMYYYQNKDIPPLILVDEPPKNVDLLKQLLLSQSGKQIKLTVPKQGENFKIVELVKTNALERLRDYTEKDVSSLATLEKLGVLLGLNKIPRYIEAYDISNTSGDSNVGAMVVFENSKPKKSAYKKFIIKTVEGQDDYASLSEVLTRRFERYLLEDEKNEAFKTLPDLILLDGGQGQVSVVKKAMDKLGLTIPIFGMVKDSKHKTRAIANDGSEIQITANREVFTLVSKIQEEVHRFVIEYHRKKRQTKTIGTQLTNVAGIGDKRAKELLKHFKTMKAIKQATPEEINKSVGLPLKTAVELKKYLADN